MQHAISMPKLMLTTAHRDCSASRRSSSSRSRSCQVGRLRRCKFSSSHARVQKPTLRSNLQLVFYNGGPQTLAWGILVAVAGALAQSASLAEMSSAQPIAGAQYHWTHHLAPARYRRFITWMQGWITWFGWVSLLAGVANVTAYMLQSLVIANDENYVPERWHLTLIIFAMLIVQGLMNVYIFWLIPWIELAVGVLHVVLFIVFVVVLTSMAPHHHDAKFVFLQRASASGWNNDYISWNLGLLTPVWGFVGALLSDPSPAGSG